MKSAVKPTAVFSFFLLWALSTLPAGADIQFAGVNLSGAEFGMTQLPGTFGTDYTYPTTTEVDYYKSKGMNFIRLPFRWERLQHTNSAALDTTELGRMNTFVSYATAHGVYVLLDPHNFMRYYPNPRSSYETATNGLVGASVPNSDFSNFWFRVAAIYRTNSHVVFGLNNEPDTMPETQLVVSENAAIAAIRAAGATNLVFVPGNRWTGAWTWSQADSYGDPNAVAMLGIVDPGSNYIFEVHQYLDSDGSGSHTTIVSVDVGWQRLTNFTAWARSNNFKGFLGEYAVPGAAIGGTNIGGLALTNMLSYIQTNSDVWLGWSYWGGGPWWGSTPLFPIEPTNIGQPTQSDQPVMDIIKQFFPLPVPTLAVVNRTQFQFNTAQGFIYQPQASTNLSTANWTSYGAAFPGTGGSTNINMEVGSSPGSFFRVEVKHAP
jgi:endoglucanase